MHKKQSGGSGQFAEVQIKFEPGEPGSGFTFTSEIKGGVVPKEYIPGVVKGLEEMMSNGALAGYPVVDLNATLYDGNYHDVDSSVLAFQIAARGAFRYAALSVVNHRIIFYQQIEKLWDLLGPVFGRYVEQISRDVGALTTLHDTNKLCGCVQGRHEEGQVQAHGARHEGGRADPRGPHG